MKITERIMPLFSQQARMRDIAIVAHIDHGKTTFSDSLRRHAHRLGLPTAD